MALQLVYTSAPKLLDAGRSGFGVVARSKSLPPLAANAIERFSKYANMQGTDRSRIVMAHRKVTIGSSRLHVLSRIRDSGSDHTGRTNHIAHHLIFSPLEIRQAIAQRLTPADVFAQFTWLDRWEGAPKAYDSSADVHIGNFLPNYSATRRAAWTATTGEPLHARLLAWDGAPKSGSLIFPAGIGTLPLLGEALAECQNPWEKTFTTSLEPTDELAELDWVLASQSDASAISRVSSRTVFDISRPLDLPVPTEAPLPKPDVRATSHNEPGAAAGQEVGASAHQERVLPPPDQSRRPIQVRTISGKAGGRVPRDNRPIPATAQSAGNGKLWLIIGGGVAALFVLIAAVLFLVQMGKPKPVENEQAAEAASKEKELATLVDRLIKVGEPKTNAEKIAGNVSQDPSLDSLPIEIANTKATLIRLGKMTSDVSAENRDNEFKNFKSSPSLIRNEGKFPEGGISRALAGIVDSMGKLLENDGYKNAKDWANGIRELEKKLESSRSITAPEWIDNAKVDRITSILWEWKYNQLVDAFRVDASAIARSELEGFIDCSSDPDMGDKLISDEYLLGIHERMGKEEERDYLKKLKAENPELWAKISPSTPKVSEKDETAANAPDKKKPKFKNDSESAPAKLENEEWCYANFKNEGNEFSVTLPDSKILTEIAKERKNQDVEISFNGTEMVKLEELFGQGITLKFNKNNIKFIREKASINISSPLKIVFKGSELKIHFNKWPKSHIKNNTLTGKLIRIPSPDKAPATYRIHIEGDALGEMEDLRSNTIPASSLNWIFEIGNNNIKDMIPRGDKTFEINNLLPGGVEVEPPGDFASVFKEAITKTRQDKKELKVEYESLNDLQKNRWGDIDEMAWEKNGLKHLESKPDAYEWLEKRFKSEHGMKLTKISRIGGKDMTYNDSQALKIMENPTERKNKPKFAEKISVQLKAGSDLALEKDFSLNIEK